MPSGAQMPNDVKTYLVLADIHWPKTNKQTLAAALDFLDENKVDGLVFQGDQNDFEEISHHTKGRPLFRIPGAYRRNLKTFDEQVLRPIEARLKKGCEKVWIIGNHERFEQDLIEEQPELQDLVDHIHILQLVERGWEIIPLGHAKKLGKLTIVHGEVLSGIGNQGGAFPSKKAVEMYAGNVLAAHSHSPQIFTKVSPVEHIQKWQGFISPVLANCNPSYLRNRASSWLNGVTIVELYDNGLFNVYLCTTVNGKFAYGGKLYSA
jgi:predicted phosphodiesterase